MNGYSILFVLLFCVVVMVDSHKRYRYNNNRNLRRSNNKKQSTPPHCTQISKDTDYLSKFKFDYPTVYIQPGQHEAYQQLFCVDPPTVNKAVTTVCDWAAPPRVQYTLGDEYMHVVRQDPTGRFLGNAVITTHQFCNHNLHNSSGAVTSLSVSAV